MRTIRKGDCILQPPKLKHREIECSDDLELLEIVSPANFPRTSSTVRSESAADERAMKIPKNFFPIVFAFFLTIIMVFVVTGVGTAMNVGFPPNFFARWMKAWIVAWMVAFPTADRRRAAGAAADGGGTALNSRSSGSDPCSCLRGQTPFE